MKKNIFDLTNPQKSIWMTEKFFDGTNINNICATLTIKKDVKLEDLGKAINLCIKNNKSLRLRFKIEEGNIKQYFDEFHNIEFEQLQLKDEEEVKKLAKELSKEVFNIEKDILFKFKLYKLKNGYGGLIIVIHHIISDAATLSIMAKDIVDNYCKIEKKEEIQEKDYSYEDYIKEEQEYLKSSKFLKDKEYWENTYKTIPEVATIPQTVESDKKNVSIDASREEFEIDKKDLEKISEFCKNHKVSNFNFFMAVYAVYLGRVNNLNDFVIGTPILNRTNFKEKHTTGMFINTAPLRIKIDENISFINFVKNIAQSSLSMLRYQKYPYQMLLENLRNKDSSIPSLYDVMLSYQVTKANDKTSEIPYEVEWLPTDSISNSLYIHLHDNDDNETLKVAYDYQNQKYTKEDIENIHKRILNIINQVLENENCLEKDIEIVTKEEKDRILNVFNNTYTDYPRDKTVVDLFEEQVKKTPDNIAVVFEEQKLTYRELNEKANSLAHYLVEQGVKVGDAIPVILNRSIDLIISMIAILKSGAIYLPISIAYPKDRINYIIENSKSNKIITCRNSNITLENKSIVNIDEFKYSQYSEKNLNTIIEPDNDIYIIYTSGSTGNPKGVRVSNRNLNNFIVTFTKYFGGISYIDRCLSSTNISFDVCIFEFFITLLNGAILYLYEEDNITDIFKYCKKIEEDRITLLYIPPNILDNVYTILSEKINLSINKILIGVEPIKNNTIEKYYNLNVNMKIINAYGPTETTICTTANILNRKTLNQYNIVPIGKPIDNSTVLILDNNLKILPEETIGELYILGDGVSNGYLNNKEKTEQNFIKLSYLNNKISYKTGDLAKWNKDGTISFIGRRDNQVKVSGHRIELGEIESCIYKFPNIEKTVAMLNENKKIVAYFTSKEKVDIEKLKTFISNRIPNYFIPNYLVQVDKFEITSNGKINKKLLPNPEINAKKNIILPKDKIEDTLLDIFKEVLKLDNISTDDNFFYLGGDSLVAINLTTKIYNRLKVQVGIRYVFNNPTIIELAKIIKTQTDYLKEQQNEIVKVEEREYYPVSSAQRRIYYSTLKDGKESILYNISGGLILDKMPDIERLNKCFKKIVEKNEALRTYFEVEDNQVVQKILKNVEFNIETEKAKNSNIEEITEDFIKPFDLSVAPLMRVKIIELKNGKGLLLIDMHHIIGDGATLEILTKEISDLYNGKRIEDKKIDYKEFSIWENDNVNRNKYKEAEKYWLSQFRDEIPILELPTNYTRPAMQNFEGKEIIEILDEKITSQINDICMKNNVTPFMLLISVYYILLSIYSRTEDIIIGTPISGRYNEQTMNIIGMFVNTLALRNKIDARKTFKEFVNQIKNQVLTSFEYQNYPLDEIIKKLGIQRETSRNALFDVMFIYQNNSYPKIKLKGINAQYYIPKTQISKFDLSLEAIPEEEQIKLRFEYCTKLFKEEFIQNFAEHYINILKSIIENIDIKISDIDLLSAKERKKILHEFNNTKSEYPKDKNVVELFEEQVNINKNKVALVFEETRLTYNQLNNKANQVANYLLERYKLKPQDVVGIFLNKSIESIIAILAIVKAGGVFVPIDTEYPVERINYILQDSEAKLVLTKEEYKSSLETDVPKVCIDLENHIYEQNSDENPSCKINPKDLIYMMYTSGSTGKPKGVMIKHQNVVRLVKNTNYIDFTENERILQTGSIVFDACTFEIWGAFLNGGTLYLIRKQNMLDQNYFEKYLKDNKITSIFLTTALFNQYCEASSTIFEKLKTLLTGGEAVSIKHMQLALENFPKLNLVHVYGPTENTTFSTYHVVNKINNNTVPIGKAIANSTTYVVSKNNQLLPIGVPGELWVGGDGVGNGYLNREGLSKEKFIDNPFGEGKIYKTGDLVRLLPDGDIEFIGRIDNQVKIRGFRIELNEIDNVIHEYPYVSKTYTIIKEIDDKKYIVTYFSADRTLNVENINIYLQEKLPFYMVPQFLIQLEEFPLTINGKIDKHKLPEPQLENLHEYIPPENEVQEQLCSIWCKLFEMKKVSILDNFFELGGDSLTAIKLQTEALKLDININYSDIFEYPTIKALSEKKQDKQLYKVDENYDYSKINELLSLNKIDNIEDKKEEIKYTNMLLCGATGFLGAHILDKYLSNTEGNIYCLIRKKDNMDSVVRLKKVLNFYFDNKYDDYFGNRINVVYGDITLDNFGLDEKEYKKLGNKIDVVVNSAAFVKHFGDFKMFQSINVIGTKNIIEFCKKFNNKLYHISTMSVAGINTPDEKINNDEERILFNETNFYVGQNLNNAYVYTKFEAEKEIFEEVQKGLQACVLRMGNISSRVTDGKFQMNVSENAFINRIKSLLNIKVIQNKFLNHAIEFTPVDSSADAIIKIIRNNPKFTVLHLFNTKVINFPDILAILKSLGYSIDIVDDKIFASKVKEFLKDDKLKSKISGLIPDLNSDKTLALLSKTLPNGYFTTLYLHSIGFDWPDIDKNYIMKYMEYFKKIGYIE